MNTRLIFVKFFPGNGRYGPHALAAYQPNLSTKSLDDCVLHRREQNANETEAECIKATADDLAVNLGLFGGTAFFVYDYEWAVFEVV